MKHRNLELQQQNSFLTAQLDQMNKNADIAHTMISSLSDQYHYLISNKPPTPLLVNQLTQTPEEMHPPTIDIAIHDQLISDLREELNDEKAQLMEDYESIKENFEVKSFEHELNLIQFQRLKEDYSTLYKLIITFGTDPVTILINRTQPEPLTTAPQLSLPPQDLSGTSPYATDLNLPSPSLDHAIKPPASHEKIQTRLSLSSTPITPATYKQKLSNFPSNSFLNLGELDTAHPTPSTPHRKTVKSLGSKKPEHAPPFTPLSPHKPSSSSIQKEPLPSHQTSLTIGTKKQILAIQSIQPVVPVQHPTIIQTSLHSTSTLQLPDNLIPGSKEIADEYGFDLIKILQNETKRRKQS